MNGHPTPRRTSAWLTLLTIFAICTLVFACALAFAGCGSGNEQTAVGGDAAVSPTVSDAGSPAEATFPITLTDRSVQAPAGCTGWLY